MSFIKLSGLNSREEYKYRVKSASDAARWSKFHHFRALYKNGPTRVAIFGDMGNTLHNNMGNLKADCTATNDEDTVNVIDAIVMLGDHCYGTQIINFSCHDLVSLCT